MGKPNISSILAKSKEIYDDIFTQLLNSEEVGVDVRLHYAPTWTPSTATVFDGWGGASINGTPDVTVNDGIKQAEVTENIKMRVYSTDAQGFGRSQFKSLGGGVYVEGRILTIGFMTDYNKIVNCVSADFYLEAESTMGRKPYKLATEVRPHGFGHDKFLFCFWDKV